MKPGKVGLLLLMACASTSMSCVASGPSAKAPQSQCESPRRLVSRSFIQALPGQKERLKAFIGANFFAIDAVAVKRGLMHSYALLEKVESSDTRPWDFMLIDTWCDEHGLASVSEPFRRITEAHERVLIDGMDLDQLGTFIGSDSVVEQEAREP